MPLDIGGIEAEVLRTRRPESREELQAAIIEAGAEELLARGVDLYELKDTLLEERRRIHEQPRTEEDIERDDPLSALIDLLWNIEAVKRALEIGAPPQLAVPSGEGSEA